MFKFQFHSHVQFIWKWTGIVRPWRLLWLYSGGAGGTYLWYFSLIYIYFILSSADPKQRRPPPLQFTHVFYLNKSWFQLIILFKLNFLYIKKIVHFYPESWQEKITIWCCYVHSESDSEDTAEYQWFLFSIASDDLILSRIRYFRLSCEKSVENRWKVERKISFWWLVLEWAKDKLKMFIKGSSSSSHGKRYDTTS